MANRTSQAKHDKMLKYVVDHLVERQYTEVKADLPGFEKPAEITWKKTGKGHVPDVIGRKDDLRIFEVETADTINDEHTKDQWTLFGKHAKENSMTFWIVVPSNCVEAARQKIQDLNIEAKIWGI